MIKWFIDNLKPLYYEQTISIQVTHFVSLISIEEHIDEGINSKKIMDAESLSSMVEQQVKRIIGCKTKEGDVHMVDNVSERPRGVALAYATLVAGPYQQQNHGPEKVLSHRDLIRPRSANTILGGHTLEECFQLRDRVQDLIDNKLIQFDNAATSNIITNPLPPHQEGNVNTIITVEERVPDFSSSLFPWKAMLPALVQESHLDLKGIRTPRFDWDNCSFCDSEDSHALFDCKVLRAQVQSLVECGII
ncbi:hypothetical protein SO802_002545 [Lithocarpus litseifolius]|uniref:Reverse transcriptase zinc-binding domain-containing protein n=1 Tax=Lithocarpus litseifolius TaxID=425828 RepID=A0AAW2DYF9_9ROSI